METPKEKGELIDNYLNYFEGLEILSLKNYAETGKVSGSLYLAVNKLLDEYAESKTTQLQSDKAELLEALEISNLQIKYLHEKFKETGSGNSILSKNQSLIQKHKQ